MSTIAKISISKSAKLGWGILLGIDIILILNSLSLYFFITTSHQEKTISLLLGGFGVMALMVAREGIRNASKWAWKVTWVMVIMLAAIAVQILTQGEFSVGL